MKQLQIVDMFCGGGGESTGITQAAKQYHFDIKLSAINHWKRAIETHTANYPFAEHYEEPVQNLDPTKVVPGGKLDFTGPLDAAVQRCFPDNPKTATNILRTKYA